MNAQVCFQDIQECESIFPPPMILFSDPARCRSISLYPLSRFLSNLRPPQGTELEPIVFLKIPSLMPFLCYNTLAFADFLMRRLGQIFAVLAVALALPASAGQPWQEVWDFDSIAAPFVPTTAAQVAAKEVYDMQMAMIEKWNAHDLEGFLKYFWNSPRLIALEDGDAIIGFEELSGKYRRGFSDRNLMGHSTMARVRIRMIGPDSAFVVAHWTIAYPNSKVVVVGMDSSNVQKIAGEWKTTMTHSSEVEM
jgi:hypothetical protein